MKLPRRALLPLLVCLAASPLWAAGPARDPLQIVASVPDLAEIATAVGGPRVQVTSLTKGSENLHSVRVRPSMLVAVRRADVFLEAGLSLESTWLPSLLLTARNSKIAKDQPGFVNCSEGWAAIEVPTSLSREGGDLHPDGNPHFTLDPAAGPHVARRIAAALSEVDPDGAELYAQRLDEYLAAVAKKAERWQRLVEGMKGKRVAVYHVEFNYLTRYAGIETAVSVESKPGVAPTPRDVARVVRELEEQHVDLILTAAWSNNRTLTDIAEKSGAKVLELPTQVDGASWAKTWIDLLDGDLVRLREAFGLPALEDQGS
ncbi:MAG: zinc ABC transporter substrate-binding protein [Planctomycetes bacterium]|nr:zinc ABC transporter substrate-binding protein [Planctomycetota bacterium]